MLRSSKSRDAGLEAVSETTTKHSTTAAYHFTTQLLYNIKKARHHKVTGSDIFAYSLSYSSLPISNLNPTSKRHTASGTQQELPGNQLHQVLTDTQRS